jgi:rod shape-determining protein MreC
VITPDGIVGKVKEVYFMSSQVLMINDRDSGAGVILEKSRLQGDLHGSSQGETVVKNVMSDEKVDVGEKVITSGGDRIYPKGLPVGNVTAVNSDPDKPLFLSIAVKPATNLGRLEEVLVITKITEELPNASQSSGPIRAADILAQRLPTVPKLPEKAPEKPEEKTQGKKPHEKPGTPGASTPGGIANQAKKLVGGTNSGVTEENTKPLVPKAPKAKKPAADQSPQATPPEATKPDKPETGPPPSNGEKPPE